MTKSIPTHEGLEDAYAPAKEVLARIPDCVEKREAERLLKVSEDVAHVAREKGAGREE